MQMVRTADAGPYVAWIYPASLPQQLLVEEHSRLEWSLNVSTVAWKCLNCLGWPLAEFCRRGTGWYSYGTLTSPFVILYIMVSLLWSLQDCKDSHPRSDTIADMETGGLLCQNGMFFTNRAARRYVISSLSVYFCWCGSQTFEQYSSLGRWTQSQTLACKSAHTNGSGQKA